MTTPHHPIQPIVTDEHGVERFKANAIVSYLLEFGESHGMGLNQLAAMIFSQDDWQQFMQLIGYSLNGWGGLSCVDDDARERAAAAHRGTPTEPAPSAMVALQRERDGWAEEAKWLQKRLRFAQADLDMMRKHQDKDAWYWQGDGYDHLESMANDMVVVMHASTLRALLSAAKPPQQPDICPHCNLAMPQGCGGLFDGDTECRLHTPKD